MPIVTENAADMIALVDVSGRRLYNSPAYERILGYTPTELGETSSFEQIHPGDRYRILEAAREARETGVGKRLEYRIKHKDGSWRVHKPAPRERRSSAGKKPSQELADSAFPERSEGVPLHTEITLPRFRGRPLFHIH